MKYFALILVQFLAAMITDQETPKLLKRNLGIPKGGFRFGFDAIEITSIHRKSRFSETYKTRTLNEDMELIWMPLGIF